MKRLSILAALLFALSALATPVTFQFSDSFGNAVTNPVTITGFPRLTSGQGTIVVAITKTFTPPLTTNLAQGIYNGAVQGIPQGFSFYVDGTTNSVNITNALTSGVWQFAQTNLSATLVVTNSIFPGANITITTNGFTYTINLGTNVPTNGALFQPAALNLSNWSGIATSSKIDSTNGSAVSLFINAATLGGQLQVTNGSQLLLTGSGELLVHDANGDIRFGDPTFISKALTSDAIGRITNGPTTAAEIAALHGIVFDTAAQSNSAVFQGSGLAALKANNLSDLSSPSTALSFLVAQSADVSALNITNGFVNIGGFSQGTNNAFGDPPLTVSANLFSAYRGTNVVGTSKENVIVIRNGDRTQAGYLAFAVGITNAGSTNSQLTPDNNFQIGLSGDLYHTRLGCPGSNFDYIALMTLNSPVDFALTTTANKGTNSGALAVWYYDNTASITYLGMNTGGNSPRDPNYKAAFVANHNNGRVDMTNGNVNIGPIISGGAALQVSAAGNVRINISNTDPVGFGTAQVNATGTIGSPIHLFKPSNSYFNVDSSGNIQIGKFNDGSWNDVFHYMDHAHTYQWMNLPVEIGTTNTPDASAVLDVQSTTKGFLPPRMTKAQRNAISSAATGMVIFQTDNTPGLRAYNGTHWVRYTETNDD